jgi:beta-N-acetylglucosaminidase
MINRLNRTTTTVNKLLEYLTTCLAEINKAFEVAYAEEREQMIVQHQEQIQKMENTHPMQQNQAGTVGPATDLEFRIVQQKLMFTWLHWTREEQISNSVGTDEKSVMSGAFTIPGYCCLQLKPE